MALFLDMSTFAAFLRVCGQASSVVETRSSGLLRSRIEAVYQVLSA